MTDVETPATSDGAPLSACSPDWSAGRPSDQALQALPAKVRVHALARVVGSSSREVLAVLARLGVGARSAQSSVDRDTVAQVIDDLFPSESPPATEIVPPADEPVAPLEDLVPTDAAEPQTATSTASASPASAAVPAPMFLAPEADSPPARPRRRRSTRSAGVVTPSEGDTGEETTGTAGTATDATPAGQTSDTASTEPEDERDADTPGVGGDAGDTGEEDDEGARRRRRRGRRGRGRGRGPSDEGGESEDSDDSGDGSEAGTGEAGTEETESTDADDGSSDDGGAEDGDDGGDGSASGSRRRRRRRRRSSDGGDAAESTDEGADPPNTVTHVRERTEKPASDEVKGVKGSTRLEAKRQRRRDGRDAGRRRPPILSESEFLARREAVERTMVVRQQAGRSQIGVLEDDVLVEHFVAGEGQNSMVGNVYLGRVQNVLPSMEAAFVDIGRGRNAVLYAGEVNWDASGLEGKQRKIEQALSSGDQVLVQVTKDPVGHKGARLTTQISLPGRFLVFVPAGGATGISRKLPDNERKRLKEILKRIVPDESGVIIRTAAEGISEADLERDVNRLTAQWEVIERKATEAKNAKGNQPTLVYEEPDLLIRVVRDMFNEDFASLVVSGGRAFDTLEGYLSHVAPELSARMTRHTGAQDVFAAHRIDEQLAKALDRKVWLPSGGTLVIDRTEAMTVVDVNTGKFTGSGGNLEETVTRNNLEAAEEVVRQLRLRDIGGMIVIDFIDMVLESNRDLVLRRLTECLGRDRTRHQVSEVTSLGLVQMTRKRVGQGLLDEFSTTCEHCRGRGVIVSTEPTVGGDHGHGAGDSPSQNGQNAQGGAPSGNGPNGDAGGQGSSGGGSGRRRGRGRRGAQSDGGPPADVPSSTPAGTDEAEADRPAVETVAAAAGPDEVRVEAAIRDDQSQDDQTTDDEAVSGDADPSAPADAAEEPDEQVTASSADEVALETDLAEHTAAGDTTESTGAAFPAPADLSEPLPEAAAAPDAEEVVEPAPSRPRRRRAASRPAGPPVGASTGESSARADAASVAVGGS